MMRAVSNWIWTPEWIHEDKKSPRIVYFRKAVELSEIPEKVYLNISADTRYKLYVNGFLVEIGPSKGDREVWFYDRVDLAPYLKAGKNILGVQVLRYPMEREQGNHSMFRTEIPGLYMAPDDGTNELFRGVLAAGPSWKCHIDRTTLFPAEEEGFAPLLIHEEVYGNEDFFGWLRADFDDSEWASALPYPNAKMSRAVSPANLNPRTIPFMYRKKRHFGSLIEGSSEGIEGRWEMLLAGRDSVVIPAQSDVRIVLNAGEEMTGYLRLTFGEGRGALVSLLESEAYVQKEKSPTAGTPIKKNRMDTVTGHLEGYRDIYHVAGLGSAEKPETFEPFWFRTFRFIELTVQTEEEPLEIFSLDYEETGYPLKVMTHVETSDPSLKSVWDLSERTLRRCMHETYEDCPFYEQLQYTMDTRSQILYTYAVSADDRLARKAIDDFARAQRSNGLLNCSYPNMNPNVIPGFSIFYILMVYDHMMYFGDKALVRRYMPAVDRILAYFDRHLTPDGLVEKVGGVNLEARYWSFIDWAVEWNPTTGMPPAGLKGPITMESLLYVYGLQHAAHLAEYIGRMDTASEYRERAMQVQKAIRRLCRQSDGLLTDGPCALLMEDGKVPALHSSQQVQVFGVLTGTLNVESSRRNLIKVVEEKGHPQCTVAMRFYLFRALEKTGLYEQTNSLWDAWRNMIYDGCTTCIESEDYARSECHAWGALALYELPSAILGVRPAAPGYEKIQVSPHAEFLDWAEGTVKTPAGDVRVSWERRGEKLDLRVEAPEGISILK